MLINQTQMEEIKGAEEVKEIFEKVMKTRIFPTLLELGQLNLQKEDMTFVLMNIIMNILKLVIDCNPVDQEELIQDIRNMYGDVQEIPKQLH